jgi:hypothetical protein
MLCHLHSDGTFSYTAPAPLFNGLDPPSPRAIELLLQGLPPSPRPPPHTPVHDLPLEIQDHILEYMSESSVEAARLGCILGLGSPFTWQRSHDPPRRGGAVELLSSPNHQTEFTPVESQIFFGDTFSGISYQ